MLFYSIIQQQKPIRSTQKTSPFNLHKIKITETIKTKQIVLKNVKYLIKAYIIQ